MRDLVVSALRQIETSASDGIWDAHHGCAAIAGALLIHERLINQSASKLVEMHSRSMLPSQKHTAFPDPTVTKAKFFETVVQELSLAADDPKELGHDVIYAAYVLKALDRFEINPWKSLLHGVVTLVHKVKRSGPGWITVDKRKERRPIPKSAESASGDYWARFALFDRPRAMEVGDMQLGHLLTHGHAIATFREFATESTLSAFDLGHRRRMFGLRAASEDEPDRTALRMMPLDPRGDRYWQLTESLGSMHGHALKYAYSFLNLQRNRLSDDDLVAFGRILWPDQPESALL